MKNPSTYSKKYYSKLLLFGEHTVLKGSHALAIPFSKFYGQWKFADSNSMINIQSLQQKLPQFLAYLRDLKNNNALIFEADLDLFEQDLKNGLYFESNIPTGYGVGSSGALCAGFYDVFGKNIKSDLAKLKDIFGQIESFFHGSSSGTDPLICYLNQPVLIQSKTKMVVTRLPKENMAEMGAFFLLDTKISRQTGPFVQIFLQKCQDTDYDKLCKTQFIPQIDVVIRYFLEAKWEKLWEIFHKIGVLQFKYFGEMIPKSHKTLWADSVKNDLFKLKLCGAGGGGFILGMTNDWKKTQKKLQDYSLIPIFRF